MKFVFLFLCLIYQAEAARLVDSVNLFVGTAPGNVVDGVPGGKGGGTQPGATLPFGMVNFGPDTDRPEQSGYDHTNDFIRGFSLTHLSGPGCRNSGELPLLPVNEKMTWPTPGLRFRKENQSALPGSYQVKFDNSIQVELTSTLRTGMARITYPSGATSPGLLLSTKRNGVGDTRGNLLQTGSTTLEGSVQGGDFCAARNFYTVYFAVEFNHPIQEMTTKDGITAVHFGKLAGQVLIVKVAISYVSQAGPLKNLKAENSQWDFYEVKKAAEQTWEEALSTIKVDGGNSEDQRTLFYTSLYRSLLHPNLASDVDGAHIGFDNKIHHYQGRHRYHNFSGWDIYRSQVQLLALLFPQRSSDMAQSLIDSGKECGAIPRWGQNNAETAIMVGDPGSVSIANFVAFGARSFDQEMALDLMLKSSFDPLASCQGKLARPGLNQYQKLGYIPEPTKGVWGPAATTLEYAIADFAVAQFAQLHGRSGEAHELSRRSENWKNLFDHETKLIRPRREDGSFIDPFSPTSLTGFVEGNAYQYTWMIPFDATELVQSIGGASEATQRLNHHLTQLNGGLSTPYLYIGNEPCFNTPLMYLWTGRADLAQTTNRRILNEEFRNSPDGLPGNDDLGALGSYYVWSSLGLFPSVPGIGGLTVSSPTFSRIMVQPEGSAKVITISAGGTEVSPYVEGLSLGGSPVSRPWIELSELMNKKDLQFKMSPLPQNWGNDPTLPMPSFSFETRRP